MTNASSLVLFLPVGVAALAAMLGTAALVSAGAP